MSLPPAITGAPCTRRLGFVPLDGRRRLGSQLRSSAQRRTEQRSVARTAVVLAGLEDQLSERIEDELANVDEDDPVPRDRDVVHEPDLGDVPDSVDDLLVPVAAGEGAP